jgi:hypothetical protein
VEGRRAGGGKGPPPGWCGRAVGVANRAGRQGSPTQQVDTAGDLASAGADGGRWFQCGALLVWTRERKRGDLACTRSDKDTEERCNGGLA